MYTISDLSGERTDTLSRNRNSFTSPMQYIRFMACELRGFDSGVDVDSRRLGRDVWIDVHVFS